MKSTIVFEVFHIIKIRFTCVALFTVSVLWRGLLASLTICEENRGSSVFRFKGLGGKKRVQSEM